MSMYLCVCRCCQCNQSGAETAQLLSKLEYEEILSILSCKEFNCLNLKECLKLGTQLTLQVMFLKSFSWTRNLYLKITHKITWISCLSESKSIFQVVTDEINNSENLAIFEEP
jgi:hypothetical protein